MHAVGVCLVLVVHQCHTSRILHHSNSEPQQQWSRTRLSAREMCSALLLVTSHHIKGRLLTDRTMPSDPNCLNLLILFKVVKCQEETRLGRWAMFRGDSLDMRDPDASL